MLKFCLAVVAIGLAFYAAFYCGVFDPRIGSKRGDNTCHHHHHHSVEIDGNVEEPSSDRYYVNNCDQKDHYENNNNKYEEEEEDDGSSSVVRQSTEYSGRSGNSPSQRLRARFNLGDCSDIANENRQDNRRVELSDNEPDYKRNPRAASTHYGPLESSEQVVDTRTSKKNIDTEQRRRKTLEDIEKCCDLFFGDRRENGNNADNAVDDNIGKTNVPIKSALSQVEDAAAEGELVPPDGGWGWLVLIASVMVNVLIPGTIKSFGVLFVEFIEVFDASLSDAAWIPSLCYFLYSSLGPLSSILSVRYSYRTVTLIGGTFAAAGMILSYYANSVGFLCISYGVFVGIGAGLSFPPTVYIVTSYFVRLRGLANGLCISGSALGSIFLPPILGFLLQEYGYRGAVLLMGAVTLNVWASALLYEPVEKHMKRVPACRDNEDEDAEAGSYPVTSPEDEKKLNNVLIIANSEDKATAPIVPKSASSVALENYKNTPVQGRSRKISVPTGRELANQMHSTPALHAVPERGGVFESGRLSKRRTARSPSSSSFNYVSTPYHGSTLSALHPEHASTMTLNAITSTFARKSPEKTAVGGNASGDDDDGQSRARFFDISLLKDPTYLVILISNSTNAVSYTNFVILLPAYAISLNFDKNMSSLLLSTVSVLDLIGRIGGSALSDMKIMPKHWYFVGGLFVSGISLALLPLATTYVWLSVYCGIFGLASGIYVGVTAVIMADMLGTEKLTSSYGISLFVNGVIQLVGPPICGLVYENIGSYGPIFSVLGIILVAGASLWALMPLIRRRRRLAAATSAPIDKL